MKDTDKFCQEEVLGLTYSAEYLRDDVRVIEWSKGAEGMAEERS